MNSTIRQTRKWSKQDQQIMRALQRLRSGENDWSRSIHNKLWWDKVEPILDRAEFAGVDTFQDPSVSTSLSREVDACLIEDAFDL